MFAAGWLPPIRFLLPTGSARRPASQLPHIVSFSNITVPCLTGPLPRQASPSQLPTVRSALAAGLGCGGLAPGRRPCHPCLARPPAALCTFQSCLSSWQWSGRRQPDSRGSALRGVAGGGCGAWPIKRSCTPSEGGCAQKQGDGTRACSPAERRRRQQRRRRRCSGQRSRQHSGQRSGQRHHRPALCVAALGGSWSGGKQ